MQDEIQLELERILSAPAFQNSKRVSDLLEHIVKAYLDGSSEKLSGITIAQDLFNKGADFKPSKDPVVRVNVARLRKMLATYYKTEGASNPLMISIPKGGYIPNISEVKTVDSTLPSTQSWKHTSLTFGLFVLCGLLAIIAFDNLQSKKETPQSTASPAIEQIERYPSVAVLPFENQTLNPRFDNLKEGFQRQVTVDLYPFHVIRVLKTNESLEGLYSQTDNQPDYAITGFIKNLEEEINVTLQLIDIKTRSVILTENVRRASDGSHYYDVLTDISAELSNNFVGPEGAIVKQKANEIKQRLSNTSHMVKDLSAIECFSRFMDYREVKTFQKLETTYQCLEKELEYNPEDSTLMSALSTLYYEIGFVNANPDLLNRTERFKGAEFDSTITLDKARSFAKKAVEIDPRNDIAHGYLADMQMADGDISGALITLKQAMASNRGNPNHISNTALVLSYLGRWEEAMPLAKESIARNPDPEPYYYLPMFYHALVHGDGEKLQANYNLLKPIMGEHMLLMFSFLKASMTNDEAELKLYKEDVQEWVNSNAEDPFYVIKFSGGSDEIFAAMKKEFEKAGIVFVDSLNSSSVD